MNFGGISLDQVPLVILTKILQAKFQNSMVRLFHSASHVICNIPGYFYHGWWCLRECHPNTQWIGHRLNWAGESIYGLKHLKMFQPIYISSNAHYTMGKISCLQLLKDNANFQLSSLTWNSLRNLKPFPGGISFLSELRMNLKIRFRSKISKM